MKIVGETEIPEGEIKGIEGTVRIWNAIVEDKIVAGSRTIVPGSIVPAGDHRHLLRQMVFIIEGECEVTTDLEEWFPVKKGDYILLDSYEPHYFRTGKEPCYLFEVRYE